MGNNKTTITETQQTKRMADQSAIIVEGMINQNNKKKRQLLHNPITAPPAPHVANTFLGNNNATAINATTFLNSFYGNYNNTMRNQSPPMNEFEES